MIWLPSQISLTYFCAGESSRGLFEDESSPNSPPCTVLWVNVHWMTWPLFCYPRMWAKCAERRIGSRSQFFLNTRSTGVLATRAWCWWSEFLQFSRQEPICVLPPENSRFGDILCNSSVIPVSIAKLFFSGEGIRHEGKVKSSWWGPLKYLGDGILQSCTPMPSLSHNNENPWFSRHTVV